MRAIGGVALGLIWFLTASCSSEDDAGVADTFIAHPRLECVEGEKQETPPVEYATDQPGAATAEDALRPSLEADIAARGSGQIVRLSDVEYGVSEDGRVVQIQRANETRPDEWHVVDLYYCE